MKRSKIHHEQRDRGDCGDRIPGLGDSDPVDFLNFPNGPAATEGAFTRTPERSEATASDSERRGSSTGSGLLLKDVVFHGVRVADAMCLSGPGEGCERSVGRDVGGDTGSLFDYGYDDDHFFDVGGGGTSGPAVNNNVTHGTGDGLVPRSEKHASHACQPVVENLREHERRDMSTGDESERLSNCHLPPNSQETAQAHSQHHEDVINSLTKLLNDFKDNKARESAHPTQSQQLSKLLSCSVSEQCAGTSSSAQPWICSLDRPSDPKPICEIRPFISVEQLRKMEQTERRNSRRERRSAGESGSRRSRRTDGGNTSGRSRGRTSGGGRSGRSNRSERSGRSRSRVTAGDDEVAEMMASINAVVNSAASGTNTGDAVEHVVSMDVRLDRELSLDVDGLEIISDLNERHMDDEAASAAASLVDLGLFE